MDSARQTRGSRWRRSISILTSSPSCIEFVARSCCSSQPIPTPRRPRSERRSRWRTRRTLPSSPCARPSVSGGYSASAAGDRGPLAARRARRTQARGGAPPRSGGRACRAGGTRLTTPPARPDRPAPGLRNAHELPPGTPVALETGTSAVFVARELARLDLKPMVIDAHEVRRKAHRPLQESDRRDALELCEGGAR